MRRSLALVLGMATATGLVLSPVGDVAVRALTTQSNREVRTVRVLNYESPGRREHTGEMYTQTLQGTPAGVTSLYVMGSSEFGVPVDQNASTWLQANASDFDMYLSGRGLQQSLYHAIELAAVAPYLQQKKVVLLVSPQWFTAGGVPARAFKSVFSYDAWQSMLANRQLSQATRDKITHRAGELMPELCTLNAPCDVGTAEKAKEVMDAPYTALSQRLDLLRETYRTTSLRQAVSYTAPWQPGATPMDSINWAAQDALARQQGAQHVTNNPYGMDDTFYTRRIAPYMDYMKGHESKVTYTNPTEYDDLQIFLDVARDLGIQVLLISLPVNGLWSDYTGLPKAESEGFAARVRTVASDNGVQLADLTEKAYEPYYFWDTLHIGWRGWLDVTAICWRFGRSA